MRFYSHATGLRIQITSGGMRPDPLVPGLFQIASGKVALFKGGFCDIADPADIDSLKKHIGYGYGKDFWSDEDRPVHEQQADKLARVEAELAALKAATGKQVITVERETPAPVPVPTKDEASESGLQRLNRLKQEAKSKGLPVARDASADDLEQALAAI